MSTGDPRPGRSGWTGRPPPATVDDLPDPGTDPGIGGPTIPPPAPNGFGGDVTGERTSDSVALAAAVVLQSERVRAAFENQVYGELRKLQERADHLGGSDELLRDMVANGTRLQAEAFRSFEAKQDRRSRELFTEMRRRTLGPTLKALIALAVVASVGLLGWAVLVVRGSASDQHQQLELLRMQFERATK